MSSETPHFGFGHACAGCEFGGTLHTGCVTGQNIRIYSGKPEHYGKNSETVVVFKAAMNIGQVVQRVNLDAPPPVEK